MTVLEKEPLTLEQLEDQTAFELPDRETALVFVIIKDVLSGNKIRVEVEDVNVAVQVCAVIQLLTDMDESDGIDLTCRVAQR
jgi:hypothetical protein